MDKLRYDKELSPESRKTQENIALQKLWIATADAKIAGAVEQVEAALEEGMSHKVWSSLTPHTTCTSIISHSVSCVCFELHHL